MLLWLLTYFWFLFVSKESTHFVEILSKLQEDPCCNRLHLDSFLSLPFQRISHLKVLMEVREVNKMCRNKIVLSEHDHDSVWKCFPLQTVLKRTASKSDVQASAEAALTEISKVNIGVSYEWGHEVTLQSTKLCVILKKCHWTFEGHNKVIWMYPRIRPIHILYFSKSPQS